MMFSLFKNRVYTYEYTQPTEMVDAAVNAIEGIFKIQVVARNRLVHSKALPFELEVPGNRNS